MMEYKYQTPMMQQYERIKSQYPDCLLFFRLGDFYELFLEDAETGSRILDITLTARSKGKDGKIPMCGVPYHSIDAYLSKIIKAGYKAAICEQTSTPQKGQDIVEREVVRIITPGTVVDENMLESKANNFILTISTLDKDVSFAYADISTGDFYIIKKTATNESKIVETICSELKKISPKEIILPHNLYENFQLIKELRQIDQPNIFPLKTDKAKHEEKVDWIKEFFNIKSIDVFEIDHSDQNLVDVSYNLLKYLDYTQKNNLLHIKQIKNETNHEYLKIDPETFKNLEIFESSRTTYTSKKSNSLFEVIDKTSTSMGARLLRKWLMFPSVNLEEIEGRLNSVEELINNHKLRETIEKEANNILDIERLLSKLGTGTANARDLQALSQSVQSSSKAINTVNENKNLAKNILDSNIETLIETANKIHHIINKTIKDEPPFSIREGGLIKDRINEELDHIKNSISDSQSWIAELEAQEKSSTGINTLKVGFNSVFGYYIEVSKTNSHLVPDNYVRKQTLVNAERYITQELKSHEEIVLNAQEKINELEYKIFNQLVEEIINYANDIQTLAKLIAKIDCINGLANLALENNYSRPKLKPSSNFKLKLEEARHPVVEKVLNAGEFTPNTTQLDKNNFIHIITGPNMSGKSTYIRQVAIIQLLAQIGSYIPANNSEISIVDGIYTRIGSGDALSQGLSTFMVEMIETAKILNNSTKNSLIILDEVGRGTSTIDGYSIARAVIEYIHNKIGSKTLFATHFHELISLEQRFKKIDNYHISVIEKNNEIKFMHKVEKGGTDKSYGIEVANLAGIPSEVVNRAKEILLQNTSSQLKLDI